MMAGGNRMSWNTLLVIILAILITLVQANDPVRPTPNPICTQELTTPRGALKTPHFPAHYPRNIFCRWKIIANTFDGIQLTFLTFNLPQSNQGQPSNELITYESDPTTGSTPAIVFSGVKQQGFSVSFNSSILWLEFKAASNLTGIPKQEIIGFSIRYQVFSSKQSCKDPGKPDHGSVSGDSLFLGSSVDYSCDQGYRLEGSQTSTCVTNNSLQVWSPVVPVCIPSCSLPDSPDHGKRNGSDVDINSNITFSCNEPFLLQGASIITCQRQNDGGGAWSAPIPSCIIPNCSNPIALTEPFGALVNPSFPTEFSLNLNIECTWKISGNVGQSIKFTSIYFDIPTDDQSFVEFSDVVNASKVSFDKSTGESSKINVSSTSNEVEVFYHSPIQQPINFRGFYIKYAVVDVIDVPTTTTTTTQTTTSTTSTTSTSQTTINATTLITTTVPSTLEISETTTFVTSTTNVTTAFLDITGDKDDDDGGATKIAIGVTIPLLILFVIAGFVIYKLYRRKYPVRMILGRDFGKFENPDYQNTHSTLSLVREDADAYFKDATSKNVSTVSLNTRSGHDNLAFETEKDFKNYNPSDDGDLMKRKSFLFKSLDAHHDWMETEFTSASSSKSEESVDSKAKSSIKTESDNISGDINNEHEHETQHDPNDKGHETSNETEHESSSDKEHEPINDNNTQKDTQQKETHLSQEELHNLKNAKEHFLKNSETIVPETVKRTRAYTQDEAPNKSQVVSARFRSQSVDNTTTMRYNNDAKVHETSVWRNESSSSSDTKTGDSETLTNNEIPRKSSDISKKSDEIKSEGQFTLNSSVDSGHSEETRSESRADRSHHSSISNDSNYIDVLEDAELSDNGSVTDIPLKLKNKSESVASLRGEIAALDAYDDIVPDERSISDTNTPVDSLEHNPNVSIVVNDQSLSQNQNESYSASVLNMGDKMRERSKSETLSSSSSSSSSSSPSSKASSRSKSSGEGIRKRRRKKRSRSDLANKGKNESSSEDELSVINIEVINPEDVPQDVRSIDEPDAKISGPDLTTVLQQSDHNEQSDSSKNSERKLENTNKNSENFAHQYNESISYPESDSVASHSNKDSNHSDKDSSLSIIDPNELPRNEPGDQPLRSPNDPVEERFSHPTVHDSSFAADSVSVHSTTISSIASVSSDEEGEYVINPELNVASPSVGEAEDTYPSPSVERAGNTCSSPPVAGAVNIPSTSESPSGTSSSSHSSKASSPDSFKRPHDNLSLNNEMKSASPSAKPVSKLSVSGSDSSDEQGITDDDIVKALEDCDSGDDSDFQPLATSEPATRTPVKPRSISIEHNFKFDDDDNDIDV